MGSAASQMGMFADIATDEEHHTDLRSREDDPTPRGVVRAVLNAWADSIHELPGSGDVLRVLDVCAGFGVWSSEMRILAAARGWPIHITGVELDERKAPHLRKWCDRVLAGVDWTFALDPHLEPNDNEYDLAIGNPHFSGLTNDDPGESMPALLLEHATAVLLFHQGQSFQKSAAGCRIWHEYRPTREFKIPGSVRFRIGINPDTGKPYGADSLCYQATYWNREDVRTSRARGAYRQHQTVSVMLPWLTPSQRKWREQPGTESADTPGLLLAPNYEGT